MRKIGRDTGGGGKRGGRGETKRDENKEKTKLVKGNLSSAYYEVLQLLEDEEWKKGRKVKKGEK